MTDDYFIMTNHQWLLIFMHKKNLLYRNLLAVCSYFNKVHSLGIPG
ncbi:hypothetical protein FLAV_02202 [Flavobacteriales bacterium]|nr:hypothetical protein FLAV_02202 [Flavobacteriales bacterium]